MDPTHVVAKSRKAWLSASLMLGALTLAVVYVLRQPAAYESVRGLALGYVGALAVLTLVYYLFQGLILRDLVRHFGVALTFAEWYGIIMITLFSNFFLPYTAIGFRVPEA